MSYFATPCDKKSSFIRSIISKDKSKPSPKAVLVNAKAGGLYTYTAERRDVLYPYTAERRDAGKY